jgi:Ulp1 family protease
VDCTATAASVAASVAIADSATASFAASAAAAVASGAAAAAAATDAQIMRMSALYPVTKLVAVSGVDLLWLEPGEWLNDTLIQLYINWIEEQLDSRTRERCIFFNTFFYTKLIEYGAISIDMARWTKGVDIFSFEYIFIPINFEEHWSLIVVAFPARSPKDDSKPIILHLDSVTLPSHNRRTVMIVVSFC